MRRRDLERHLRAYTCEVKREGGNHTIWINTRTRQTAPVPRHTEIKEGTVQTILVGSWAFRSRRARSVRLPELLSSEIMAVFTRLVE